MTEFSRGFPSADEYVADAFADFSQEDVDDSNMDDNDNYNIVEERVRKERVPNAYPYQFGRVFEANWFLKFLAPNLRERTYYLSSRDRYGKFRSLFRMTLDKIDDLVSIYTENG